MNTLSTASEELEAFKAVNGALMRRARNAEAELSRLRALIDAAPHEFGCRYIHGLAVNAKWLEIDKAEASMRELERERDRLLDNRKAYSVSLLEGESAEGEREAMILLTPAGSGTILRVGG